MYKLIAVLAIAAAAVPAQSAVVVVQAQANSSGGGTGLVFGPVSTGQGLVITSSTNDLWSAGPPFRISDANGLTGDRFAVPGDDSGAVPGTQIGANYGFHTQGNLTAHFGTLVGRIGSTYQLLGANYNGTAWGTGNLELFYWDSNNFDNFGEITFNITAVPEPGAWALMILGFGATGAALRSRRKTRTALTFA